MRKVLMATALGLLAAGLVRAADAPPPTAAEKKALEQIRQLGGLALELAQNDNRLEVSYLQSDGKFSDAYLAPLKDLKRVVHLNLRGLPVTDAQLAYLKDLTGLTELHLEKTKVTDKGLEQLKGLVNLEYLNLYGTAVTDAGLPALEAMKKLKHLYLWQTKVTAAGAARLKKALPSVDINLGLDSAPPAVVQKPAEAKKPAEKKTAEAKKAPEKKTVEVKKVPEKKSAEAKKLPGKKIVEVKKAPDQKPPDGKQAPELKVAEPKKGTGKKDAEVLWAKEVATDFLNAGLQYNYQSAEALATADFKKTLKNGPTSVADLLIGVFVRGAAESWTITSESMAPEKDEVVFRGTFKGKKGEAPFSLRVMKEKESGKWRICFFAAGEFKQPAAPPKK